MPARDLRVRGRRNEPDKLPTLEDILVYLYRRPVLLEELLEEIARRGVPPFVRIPLRWRIWRSAEDYRRAIVPRPLLRLGQLLLDLQWTWERPRRRSEPREPRKAG